jgi:hypothetical protein
MILLNVFVFLSSKGALINSAYRVSSFAKETIFAVINGGFL